MISSFRILNTNYFLQIFPKQYTQYINSFMDASHHTMTYLGTAPYYAVTLRRQRDRSGVDYFVSVQKPYMNCHVCLHTLLSLATVAHHKPELVPVRGNTGLVRRLVPCMLYTRPFQCIHVTGRWRIISRQCFLFLHYNYLYIL